MSELTPIVRACSGSFPRCLETHPALDIGGFKIYGGSCSSPMITNADVYVGFDLSMKKNSSQWPWEPGESVLYPIPDMGVPHDAEEFKKLVAWLAVQLTANKLIHLGCIGGHGRTGMVLSALHAYLTGEKDSITYVRKNYCEKAVESAAQVRFLHTHFGITEVAGAKDHGHGGGHSKAHEDWYSKRGYSSAQNPMSQVKKSNAGVTGSNVKVDPTTNPINIWGGSVSFDKPKKRDTMDLFQGGK